eukprot:scaffold9357_cov267-Chaetoceros_neogracile.AAC.15
MIDAAAATWKPVLECLAEEVLMSVLDGAAPLSVSLDVSFVLAALRLSDGSTDGSPDGKSLGSSDGRIGGSSDGKTLGSSDESTDGSSDGKTLGSSDGRTEGSSDGKALGSSDGKTLDSSEERTEGSSDGMTLGVFEPFFECLVEGCLVEVKASPLTGLDTTLEKFTFEPFLADTWAEIVRRIVERKSFEIIISVSSQLMRMNSTDVGEGAMRATYSMEWTYCPLISGNFYLVKSKDANLGQSDSQMTGVIHEKAKRVQGLWHGYNDIYLSSFVPGRRAL